MANSKKLNKHVQTQPIKENDEKGKVRLGPSPLMGTHEESRQLQAAHFPPERKA